MKHYIGVEIGGTKQQTALFDETGKMLRMHSERIPLPRGAQDILDWMKEKINDLRTGQTVAIGVGFGGIVDTTDGRSACSVHVPGWDQFPIKAWFEETFNLPTTVVNDTVCGGYAEVLQGAGVGVDSFFYTNIGTGCGGGMFINGKNYDGICTGGAYHGQIFVPSWDDPNTPIRMEEICRGPKIEERLRTPGYVPESSKLYEMCGGDVKKLTCVEWAKAAREGDEFALMDIDRWARSYAIALSTLITLMAPRRIAIGGGVANAGDVIFDAIRKHVDELIFISMKGRYEIVQCKTMDVAVLIGAAMYARDGFITL